MPDTGDENDPLSLAWLMRRPPRPADPGPHYDANMDAFYDAMREGYLAFVDHMRNPHV